MQPIFDGHVTVGLAIFPPYLLHAKFYKTSSTYHSYQL